MIYLNNQRHLKSFLLHMTVQLSRMQLLIKLRIRNLLSLQSLVMMKLFLITSTSSQRLKLLQLSSQLIGAVELISRHLRMHKFELCYHMIEIQLVGHRLFKCLVDLHAAKELSLELSMLFLFLKQIRMNCLNKHKMWTIKIDLIEAGFSKECFHTTLCLKKMCKDLLKLRLMQTNLHSKPIVSRVS